MTRSSITLCVGVTQSYLPRPPCTTEGSDAAKRRSDRLGSAVRAEIPEPAACKVCRERTQPQRLLPLWSPPERKFGALYDITRRSVSAADSGVMSRCGEPSSSNPTMNLRMVADRSNGG